MENSTLNILAVAQEEYMDKLNEILTPFLLTNFEQLYDQAIADSKGKNGLMRFQEYLRDVKTWNNSKIKERTDEIRNSFSHIKELVAAVIVGYVKIMSAIRLNDVSSQKIPIKLPRLEDFIFRVYEKNAEAYYKDPYWFQQKLSEDEKLDKVLEINLKILKQVLKSIVPLDKILDTYISQGSMPSIPDSTEVESQIGDDSPDPDVLGSDDQPTGDDSESMGIDSEPPSVPAQGPIDPPPAPEEEEDEIPEEKTIPITGAPPMPQEAEAEDDDVLFPDANDTRKTS